MFLKTKFKNREKGFTLIELLVVVAIIGILASTILVSLGSARAKARDARRVSDISQLKNALELYFSTYGRYPKSAEFAKGTDTATEKYMSPSYMPNMPTDPLSGVSYSYAAYKLANDSTGKCLSYHLGASLESATAETPVMTTDADRAAETTNICTGGGTDFAADIPAQNGKFCDGSAGPDATVEYCYDVTP
jgi:type II secretion system protein G